MRQATGCLWRIALALGLLAASLLLPPAPPANAETGTIRASGGLRLRSGIWGPVVGGLPDGSTVRINARTRAADGAIWYYVTTASGALGWVYGEYVANNGDARARVGIQAGHWRYLEAPYPFNLDSGTKTADLDEEETNLAIALVLSRRLSARGIAVDLLPTAIPPGYKAAAVVAIHSDAGPSYVRGFFVDRPPRSPVAGAEARLSRLLISSHSWMTGIPYVRRSTPDSSLYYGFRAVDAFTPIVLIETGCLTNVADRSIIVGRPDLVADGLAGAIAAFVLE